MIGAIQLAPFTIHMPHKNGKKYYSASERALIEMEKQQEMESMIPMNPVVRDLGMDKHINYEEISPTEATKAQVEKSVGLMTEAEKRSYYSIRAGKR